MALPRSSEIIQLQHSIERAPAERWAPIVSRIIMLLAPDDAFPELLINPLTLAPHQRLYDDPTMTKAMTALTAIFGTLYFTRRRPALAAQFRDPVVRYIRRWWSTLVRWLNFIQPKQQCVIFCIKFAKVLATAYDPLTRYKASFLDLMEQTPEVISLLFDLWLHFPMYSQTTDRFSTEARRLFDEIHVDVMVFVRDDDGQSRSWITEALLVTGMRPKRLYRQIVENICLCRDTEGALVVDVCREHFHTMGAFIWQALTIPHHSRDTIRMLVELFVELEARSSTHDKSKDAAIMACRFLLQIWCTSEDDRSLLRALQLGVLPKMISLNVRTDGQITRILAFIFKRSIFFPVARLLGDKHPVPLFGSREWKTWWMVPSWILSTMDDMRLHKCLVRTLMYVATSSILDEQVRLKICRCSTVVYCSQACQRVHWSEHKPKCREFFFRLLPGSAWLRRIEIQFAAIFTIDYLQRHGSDIMAEVDAEIAAHAESPAKRVYWVHFNYHLGIRPSHQVFAVLDPGVSDISQPGVAVMATLGSIRGGLASIYNDPYTVASFREFLLGLRSPDV
ncbi:uncharacterized protein SCHCODRAFT_02705795 [Schizophyllum commune H4-8]|uniref:uncharacterized protein n=1 Tax=Schizophyllum commune (strain H4-8 / FGSC 9210) TaxID=578458 RepID=UPI0021600EBD|nr:uncharacterized protein SCHCODRAFT_02705795 [Schizophyllum commune H4-8]KAI5887317.1 hypothetical protein SCHCODRAFT_02705795 [Schizophyllum commune H4-8]